MPNSLVDELNVISQTDISSFEFVHSVIELINKSGMQYQDELKTIIDTALTENPPYQSHTKEFLFSAYYALGCYYKRYDRLKDLFDLDYECRNFFSYAPLHLEIASWYFRRKGDLQEALRIDRQMMSSIPATLNAAPHISFASSVSKLLRIEINNRISGNSSSFWNQPNEKMADWENAVDGIKNAMREYYRIRNGKQYGKHYAILGRLLMCTPGIEDKPLNEMSHILDEAEKNFKLAIQYEDEKEQDYFKRYNEYMQDLNECTIIRMQLTLKRNNKNFADKIDELSLSKEKLQESIDGTIAREIQIVSVFTAIVAIILGSIQIALKLKLIQAEILISILALICLLLVSVVVALTSDKEKMRNATVLSVITVILIVVLMFFSRGI